MAKTILYVDDEEDIRITVQAFLQKQGFRVVTACDAPQALALATAEPPDIVITDVMMPGQSGYSLCQELRRRPATKDIPVIVATVLDDEARALESGASAFLTKPFLGKQLFDTIQAVSRPSPDDASALEGPLGHLRAGDLFKALEGFEAVKRNQPTGAAALWARYYIARIHDHEGNPELAADGLRGILADDATFWRAHNRLGDISLRKGERGAAVDHFRKSLSLCPSQPDIQRRLEEVGGRA